MLRPFDLNGLLPKTLHIFYDVIWLTTYQKKIHLLSEDGTTKYFPMTSLLAEKNHGYKIKQTIPNKEQPTNQKKQKHTGHH